VPGAEHQDEILRFAPLWLRMTEMSCSVQSGIGFLVESMNGDGMRHPVRLGIVAVASPLEVGAGQAPELLTRLQESFAQAGLEQLELVIPPETVAASWFEDYLVLDMLEECYLPVIAWAWPGLDRRGGSGPPLDGRLWRPASAPQGPGGDDRLPMAEHGVSTLRKGDNGGLVLPSGDEALAPGCRRPLSIGAPTLL